MLQFVTTNGGDDEVLVRREACYVINSADAAARRTVADPGFAKGRGCGSARSKPKQGSGGRAPSGVQRQSH